MTSETIQIILGLAYVFTTIVGVYTISNLKATIDSQQSLLSFVKDYKVLFDPKVHKDNLELRLENERILYKKEIDKEYDEKKMQNYWETVQFFNQQNNGIAASWNEITNAIAVAVLTQYPTFASKIQRDEWIKKYYPASAIYLIELVDFFQTNTSPKDQAPLTTS
jgi:hypothetical protein